MNKIRSLISALLGLLALVALVVVMAWLLGAQGPRPRQQVFVTRPVSPLRTPVPGLVKETPTLQHIILITPHPTYVPPPTPTPRPWSEVKPLPIPGPAKDPSGTILYITFNESGDLDHYQCTIHAIQVDMTGQPLGKSREITTVENCGEMQASPDGRYLAIPQGCGNAGVHPIILDIETLQKWPLFGSDCAAFGLFHGWHPDSKHVLFGVDGFSSSFQFAEGQSWQDAGLWLVDIEMGEYSVLAGEWVSGGAAVSPDGTHVVYGGGGAAWVVSLDGVQRERLDAPVGYLRGWSPNGKWILSTGGGVYATNVLDGRHIQLDSDVTGRGEGSLSSIPGNVIPTNWLAAWSPDNHMVAVTQVMIPKEQVSDFDPFEAGNIYLMDVFGEHKRPLLLDGTSLSAAWSPDGSMLAFLSDRSGSIEVWIANTDGTNLYQLTHEGPTRQFTIYYAPIWISSGE